MKKTIGDLISSLEIKENFEKIGFVNLKAGTKSIDTNSTNLGDCPNLNNCSPTNQSTNCGGGNLILCAY